MTWMFWPRASKKQAIHCYKMFSRPLLHRWMTSFFVVVSLLFSQLALASYVCPSVPGTDAMAEMIATGVPCEGMDTAQPVLCFQHAADMSLSFDPVKLTTPSLPAIVQLVVMPVALVSESHAVPQQAVPEWQHPPPDPVFLATRRLRV
ncbi:hypothetical protein PY257_02880 [Ramlibacter sp. H39-3-26]|jgi:hypothetical protein|nr:hypothetical protein [Ramlibacter sp. H39-3-26]